MFTKMKMVPLLSCYNMKEAKCFFIIIPDIEI